MPWSRGRSLVWDWDATCVDTLCKSYVPITSRTAAGVTAAKADKKKKDLYTLLPNQYQFFPFAVETIGPSGDDAHFVRELRGRLCAASDEPREMPWLNSNHNIHPFNNNNAPIPFFNQSS